MQLCLVRLEGGLSRWKGSFDDCVTLMFIYHVSCSCIMYNMSDLAVYRCGIGHGGRRHARYIMLC